MPTIRGQLDNLVALLRGNRGRGRPSSKGNLIGSQDQILPGGQPRRKALQMLDIPELPLRPILLDHSISRSLLEMSVWSLEFSSSLRLISQNCFQTEEGDIGSWKIREENSDGTPLEDKPDDYVIGLAKDLANRYNGRDMVLGGQRLEAAVRNMHGFGDSFMEVSLENDGLGSWQIGKSIYLPTFSTFVQEDEHGQILGYRQQSKLEPAHDDTVWNGVDAARILHFRCFGTGRYGHTGSIPMVETWESVKETAANLIEASRSSAILPNLHIQPEEKSEAYKQQYRAEYEEQKQQGIITDIYLSHGADVRKMAAATPSLKPLLDYYMQLRYQMIYGIPLFLIPGLGLEQGASKELAQGPSLAYKKQLSTLRSYLAEQIVWCIGLECTLAKGYDYWEKQRSKVRIQWPDFMALAPVPGLEQDPKLKAKEEEKATEQFIKVNGHKAAELFR